MQQQTESLELVVAVVEPRLVARGTEESITVLVVVLGFEVTEESITVVVVVPCSKADVVSFRLSMEFKLNLN